MNTIPSPRSVEERVLPVRQIEIDENFGRIERSRPSREFTEDVRQNGLINPITVEEIGRDRYRVIAGETRFLTVRDELREEFIRCSVRVFQNEWDARFLAISENRKRKSVSLYEETILVHRLVTRSRGKVDPKEVSKRLHLSPRDVKAMIRAPEVLTARQLEDFRKTAHGSRVAAMKYLRAAEQIDERARARMLEEGEGRNPKKLLSRTKMEQLRALIEETPSARFRGKQMSPRERTLVSHLLSACMREADVPFDKPNHRLSMRNTPASRSTGSVVEWVRIRKRTKKGAEPSDEESNDVH